MRQSYVTRAGAPPSPLIAPEPREERRLARAHWVRAFSHRSAAPKADGKPCGNQKDEGDKGQPEAGARLGRFAEAEVAHLVLDICVKGNVDDERQEHEEGGEERRQRRDERHGNVLREAQQEGDERDTRGDRGYGEPTGPARANCLRRMVALEGDEVTMAARRAGLGSVIRSVHAKRPYSEPNLVDGIAAGARRSLVASEVRSHNLKRRKEWQANGRQYATGQRESKNDDAGDAEVACHSVQ